MSERCDALDRLRPTGRRSEQQEWRASACSESVLAGRQRGAASRRVGRGCEDGVCRRRVRGSEASRGTRSLLAARCSLLRCGLLGRDGLSVNQGRRRRDPVPNKDRDFLTGIRGLGLQVCSKSAQLEQLQPRRERGREGMLRRT